MIDYSNTKLNKAQTGRWRAYSELCGAKTFIPNKPQADFIRAVGNCLETEKRIFLVTSGNGTGKTTAVWNVLANIIYPNILNIYDYAKDLETGKEYEGFFNYPLYRETPKRWPRNIWYVSNKDSLTYIHTEMPNWIPKNDYSETYSEHKDGKTYVSKVHYRSGWNLFYKTIDQDPKTYESANISIVVFDEPPPKKLFTAAVSRLRSGGIILMPCTPLWGAGWFMDSIIEKIGVDVEKWHQQVSVWENCVEKAGKWNLGVFGIHPKGNLLKKDIDFMINNWAEEEKPARIYGKMMQLSGLIIKNYDPAVHSKSLQLIPRHPLVYNYRFVVDPHDRRFPFAAWYRLDQWGRIELIREWPSLDDPVSKGRFYFDIPDAGHYTIQDFVDMWMDIENELKIPKNRITDIIDPLFGKKPVRETGHLVFEDYIEASRKSKGREYSFILNVNNGLADGHAAIRSILKPTLNGDYMFTISDQCKNSNRALMRYAWKKETDKREEEMGLSDKVQEKYKDPVDVLRYCLIVPWDYEQLEVYQNEDEEDYGYSNFQQNDWRRRISAVKRPDGAEGV